MIDSVYVKINKPWGSYQDLFRSKEVVVKIITVDPGEEISYQTHEKRGEFWYIQSGGGLMILNGDEWHMFTGQSITIEQGDEHQIINRLDNPLIIYEMQYGECDENDIVRLRDKYNREIEKKSQFVLKIDGKPSDKYVLSYNNKMLCMTLNKRLAKKFEDKEQARKILYSILEDYEINIETRTV